MLDEKIRGKEGVFFSINPICAINWINENRNKNAFLIYSHIMFKKNYKKYRYVTSLNEGEFLISTKDISRDLKLTTNQVKRALENLFIYGFIEMIEFKPTIRISGMKKINILINLFDPKTSNFLIEYQNEHGGIWMS
jgi:DNA-binding transcriptional regulator YhcF (GntR family)